MPAPASTPALPSGSPDLPPLLRFAPVPVKARHDGWSAERQRRFVLALARGAGVDEAARGVGCSRQSAYALRRRSGGGEFAAAWDAALAFADQARAAASAGATLAAIGTLMVPRFYRGRLIGFVQREDLSGLMARLARLDALADRLAKTPGRPGQR